MNRHQTALITMMGFLFLSVSNSLFAISSYSNADYLRTLNRSASVGTMDAMFFNPAGTVRLPDGIYIQGGVDFPVIYRALPTLASPYKRIGLGLPLADLGFVYKRAGSSVFVTLMPSVGNGLNLPGLTLSGKNPPPAGMITVMDADYSFKNITYELTAGGAFSFNDIVAMSFGARLITDMSLTGVNYTYIDAGNPYKEKYSNNLITFGAAMHAGLLVTPSPWFAMSINLHSGGFAAGKNNVKSVILPTAGAGKPPSDHENRPQSGGSVVNGLPARMDLGFLFNVNDVMNLQLTGQARVELFKNTPTGVSFDLPSVSFGYSAGLGMDFKFSKNFTWGLGLMYSDDTTKDTAYYSAVDSLNIVKLRSITVGTGFSFNIGEMFGLSLGAAYPLYFTTENGFSLTNLTMPGGGQAQISDILIALGINIKMDGLF